MSSSNLLDIQSLKISLASEGVELVKGIDFTIPQGQTVALLGASGSGKSLTALSLMNLLSDAFDVSGKIFWNNKNLLDLPRSDWRKLCGSQISMIFQEPMTSLNPVMRVVDQVAEVLVIHHNESWESARQKAQVALEEVGVHLADRLNEVYPHELSGGQRQRVMIAMATIARPKLLIADEPTTALDVTVQSQILQLLQGLQKKYGMSILFITHDLNLVKRWVDTIYVMSEGQIIEKGSVDTVLQSPQNTKTQEILRPIVVTRKATITQQPPLLEIKDVSLTYSVESAFLKRSIGQVQALKNISVSVPQGSTLGIVGESGCGKSSLAKVILGLLAPQSGEVIFDSQPLHQMNPEQSHQWRQSTQMVFQDPKSSLNPMHNIEQLLSEPLQVHRSQMSAQQRRERVALSLERVGLNPKWIKRYPSEFSGGQRQRIAIARALVLDPKLVVLDEAVSALDSQTRAQTLDLLIQLQAELRLTYVFISHDVSVVKSMADNLAVMKEGQIVESGTVHSVTHEPRHPYTKELLQVAADI